MPKLLVVAKARQGRPDPGLGGAFVEAHGLPVFTGGLRDRAEMKQRAARFGQVARGLHAVATRLGQRPEERALSLLRDGFLRRRRAGDRDATLQRRLRHGPPRGFGLGRLPGRRFLGGDPGGLFLGQARGLLPCLRFEFFGRRRFGRVLDTRLGRLPLADRLGQHGNGLLRGLPRGAGLRLPPLELRRGGIACRVGRFRRVPGGTGGGARLGLLREEPLDKGCGLSGVVRPATRHLRQDRPRKARPQPRPQHRGDQEAPPKTDPKHGKFP